VTDDLPLTEALAPRSAALDTLGGLAIVTVMNDGDTTGPGAVRAALPTIPRSGCHPPWKVAVLMGIAGLDAGPAPERLEGVAGSLREALTRSA
jgi:N-acetylmuramic acid 6-phosphate (MurNAc-6-P) etherase